MPDSHFFFHVYNKWKRVSFQSPILKKIWTWVIYVRSKVFYWVDIKRQMLDCRLVIRVLKWLCLLHEWYSFTYIISRERFKNGQDSIKKACFSAGWTKEDGSPSGDLKLFWLTELFLALRRTSGFAPFLDVSLWEAGSGGAGPAWMNVELAEFVSVIAASVGSLRRLSLKSVTCGQKTHWTLLRW